MPLREALNTQMRVLYALMLRDLRSRFFGNSLGFLFFSVAWPLIHILVLLVINGAAGRIVPYGDSPVLYFSVGLIPFMTFSYTSRWIMIGLVLNKPLLAFPIVRITDVLFARAILEILGSCITTISLVIILWLIGVDFVPRDITQASFAFGAAILLGFGMGVINAIIGLAFYFWITAYTLVIIITYMASGVMFVPDALPEQARYYLSFNPVLHAVEWMRSAYYDGYGSIVLDKGYLLAWGVGTTFLGLLLERLIRGRLLRD